MMRKRKKLKGCLSHWEKPWNKGSGYFYWSYKLLTDTVNDKGWIGWDSWDLGRCVDFSWFPTEK